MWIHLWITWGFYGHFQMVSGIGREELEELASFTDPRRVRRAREAAGLTQTDLASRISATGYQLSAAALSQIERGVTRPSPDTLAVLASVLEHPVRFFGARGGAPGSATEPDPYGFFRSLRSTSSRDRRRALAHAFLIHDVLVAVERHVRLPEVDLPWLPLGKNAHGPAGAAREVRRAWGIAAGPVSNVVRLLERQGVIVARLAHVGPAVDAFSVRFPDRPVIVLGNDKGKRGRSRFDGSHELGHLVMHADATGREADAEKEAHAFAAEFLMPAAEIVTELQAERLTWSRLLDLKMRWGTSIAAIVRRARDLDVISPGQYTNWMKAISARGWRRDEPGDLELGPPEASTLLDIVEDHLSEAGTSIDAVAAEAGLPHEAIRLIVEASRDPRPRLQL